MSAAPLPSGAGRSIAVPLRLDVSVHAEKSPRVLVASCQSALPVTRCMSGNVDLALGDRELRIAARRHAKTPIGAVHRNARRPAENFGRHVVRLHRLFGKRELTRHLGQGGISGSLSALFSN